MQYKTYEEVPWFRKNWFAILSWFVFWPASLVIMWTGDVYYVKKGELKTYGKVAKIIMSLFAIGATLNAFGVL